MIAPCRCLLQLLRFDAGEGKVGARAVCRVHSMFGIVLRDGTIGGSREPFRQRVVVEPASESELEATRRTR